MPASIHMRGNYWNLTWDSMFLVLGKTNFLAHNYILCIHLDVMKNIGDDQ